MEPKIIGIYKPIGPTSHDVVSRIRRITGEKRVGHAGTLDPLASGILVIGIGREATKKLGDIVGQEKEYIAEITLGTTSTTDDREGEKTKSDNINIPSQKEIVEVLHTFVGNIEQVPPQFSAIKVGGVAAYKKARRGVVQDLKPRPVEIRSIELTVYQWPTLSIRVVCGKGVYIRSLARDIGEKLTVGGYMSALERTRVGEFTKEKALFLDTLTVDSLTS